MLDCIREYIILYFQYSFELLYMSSFGSEALPHLEEEPISSRWAAFNT